MEVLTLGAARGYTTNKIASISFSLKEFVRFHYANIQNNTLFSFLNDSKTVMGGNAPAWEIEYKYTDFMETTRHILDTLTIANGTYYLLAVSFSRSS